MKQEEKKPMHLWIEDDVLNPEISATTIYREPMPHTIHFIEISAYLELKAKLETAKRTLEHYSCSYQQVISTGTDLARAALKEIE